MDGQRQLRGTRRSPRIRQRENASRKRKRRKNQPRINGREDHGKHFSLFSTNAKYFHGQNKRSVVVCADRVRPGGERDFVGLLKRHWPTFRKLRLVHEQPGWLCRDTTLTKISCFVEMFAWKDRGFEVAHKHPEVLAISEPIEANVPAARRTPATDFPHFAVDVTSCGFRNRVD
jgi:hypothetical protein